MSNLKQSPLLFLLLALYLMLLLLCFQCCCCCAFNVVAVFANIFLAVVLLVLFAVVPFF